MKHRRNTYLPLRAGENHQTQYGMEISMRRTTTAKDTWELEEVRHRANHQLSDI